MTQTATVQPTAEQISEVAAAIHAVLREEDPDIEQTILNLLPTRLVQRVWPIIARHVLGDLYTALAFEVPCIDCARRLAQSDPSA